MVDSDSSSDDTEGSFVAWSCLLSVVLDHSEVSGSSRLLTGRTLSKSDDSPSTLGKRLRLELRTRSEGLGNTTEHSPFRDSANLFPLVQDCDDAMEDCACSSRAVLLRTGAIFEVDLGIGRGK